MGCGTTRGTSSATWAHACRTRSSARSCGPGCSRSCAGSSTRTATGSRSDVVARVAVFLPVEKPYDYAVPPALAGALQVGTRVWVPWGSRSVEGAVVALDPADADGQVRPIARLVDAPPIPAD